MSGAPAVEVESACPSCGASLHPGDAFCEACGTEVAGDASPSETGASASETTAALPEDDPALLRPSTAIIDAPRTAPTVCLACGGAISDDGFCSVCGARGRTWRDHWTETPSTWVGAVCDRGISHARNEDAMATMATDSDVGFAVLVVCDGVTSAPDSDQASLAAAVEARDHLVGAVRASTHGAPTSAAAQIEAGARWMSAACRVAQVAVLGVTERLSEAAPGGVIDEPPSCTFVAAAVVERRLVVGWCGDSRAYWLPDDAPGVEVSTDHSLASELIASGMTRVEAEQHPTAHTITRWLGADSPTPTPDTVSLDLVEDGWVLVCSDGMWNYASTPAELARLIADARADGATTPTTIAESMAAFANEAGGHDNISVVLARIGAPRPPDGLTTSDQPSEQET